ncbi:response regulator [Nocardioides sp. URHA0032]|uniref:response regulator n=1 Tax=Nocardioides sp. URHA0032 TaxID=1380388 RepID=UPI000684BA6B|nr:response regulator [Nocardioides sp. URHA0032]
MELATLYRDIVETSPDAIWVFDLDGRLLYANPALHELFGADGEEMASLTVFDTLDEPGRAQFAEHLEVLRGGKVNDAEVESMFVRRDGSSVWVILSESFLRGPDGEVVGVLHRMTDYSERHQALDDLTVSRRRLAEAQRIARIGSWEWDVGKNEIWGSDELIALYGLDPDSFPASYADFLEIVHEADRPPVDAAVQGALEDGGSFVFVARVQRTDDTWVWTRGRGVATTDDSGRVTQMYGTHQDITETKQAELALEDQVRQNTLLQAVASAANEAATLREVLAQARYMVLLHDDWERGRAFLPNADHTAVEPLHITEEDRLDDLRTPEESAMELALAGRAFRERRSVWDERRLTIAFPVSYAEEVVAVLTMTSAPPLYRFEMIESMVEQVAVQLGRVAERERSQRELADARDGALAASKQKSEFLATMSHEIRTPLNGVIGLNDLLLRTSLDADQLRLASGVQVASRALLSVINDVLDFSKIEAGKLELERLDFEVRPVFDQVASLLAESARAKGLELMVSCHPEVPEVLAGDPTRLAQVLINLGSNAVKFTAEGQVVVRATSETGDDGRTCLRVTVADTGVGVPEVDVDTLFEAFTQADASTTRRYGGTGLGLAISKEIVAALGGEIGLEPNPGGGSVFSFTARFDAPVGPAVDPDDEYARSWLAGRHVLVVDDNDHNRLILEEQLDWWRVRSASASGADEAEVRIAEALAAGDPFEGVLLDMSMPGRDGLDLARALGGTPAYRGLVRLMLTSATTPEHTELDAAGIVACLTKPVLAAELRRALLRQLAGVEPRPLPEPPAAGRDGRSRRVLVVEDNPVNQLVAVGLLEALGYATETADDGAVALETLADGDFDLVLMDVQMPRMDGYAATRAIRERGSRIPVIAMTAAAVEGERDRCLAAGMDDFLTKPVDPAALGAVLDLWIGDGEPVERSTVPRVTEHRDDATAGLEHWRLDELRDLDPGNTTYLDRAIGNFVRNTPGTLASIRDAVAAGDAPTLKQVAHKLAGGALNLGVTAAGRTAQEIELAADTGSTDGAATLLPRLETALEEGRAALLAYQAAYTRS